MTGKLREELARIGDASPRVAVPSDVWARGRRARRRDRVVAGAAVLSVVAMLAGLGLVLGLPGRDDAPPVSRDDAGAVPSVIHGVPARFGYYGGGADETWSPKVAESDLAVGRASVAFGSGEHQALPVVITAADGRYHPLRLPGWIGSSLAGTMIADAALALSPDGRQLAYGWYDASTFDESAVAAGVRVVDLEVGRIRTVPLEGGRGVAVGSLRWSPDSRWLVWQGGELKLWEKNRTSWRRDAAGRIAPGATTSEPIRVSRGRGETLAVGNDGTVSWTDGSGWRSLRRDGHTTGVTDIMQGQSGWAASASPSGRTVALTTAEPTARASFVRWVTRRVDGTSHEFLATTFHDLPVDSYPEGAAVEPLGWVDEGHVLSLVTPADEARDSGWTNGTPELVVMSVAGGDDSTYDVVGRVARGGEEVGRIRALTVAVDLMTLDQPTRDFPAPEWPMSDERKWGTAALVVVPLVVLALVVRQRRRNRLLA